MSSGTSLLSKSILCSRCERAVDPDDSFCSGCGAKQVFDSGSERPILGAPRTRSPRKIAAAFTVLGVCGPLLVGALIFTATHLIRPASPLPKFELSSSNFSSACEYLECDITASFVDHGATGIATVDFIVSDATGNKLADCSAQLYAEHKGDTAEAVCQAESDDLQTFLLEGDPTSLRIVPVVTNTKNS